MSLTNVLRDIGGGKKDHGHWKVLAEGDVEARFAMVFDSGTLEHRGDGVVESALFGDSEQAVVNVAVG